jgi:hypothetical protein
VNLIEDILSAPILADEGPIAVAFGWPVAFLSIPIFLLALAFKKRWIGAVISMWILISLFVDILWTKSFGWGLKGDLIQIPCALIALLYFLTPSKGERKRWGGRR